MSNTIMASKLKSLNFDIKDIHILLAKSPNHMEIYEKNVDLDMYKYIFEKIFIPCRIIKRFESRLITLKTSSDCKYIAIISENNCYIFNTNDITPIKMFDILEEFKSSYEYVLPLYFWVLNPKNRDEKALKKCFEVFLRHYK